MVLSNGGIIMEGKDEATDLYKCSLFYPLGLRKTYPFI